MTRHLLYIWWCATVSKDDMDEAGREQISYAYFRAGYMHYECGRYSKGNEILS